MGRKKKRTKVAPNPNSLSSCIWQLVRIYAWYDHLWKRVHKIKDFQNGTGPECLEMVASADREILKIMENSIAHVAQEMEDLLSRRQQEDFCAAWVDLLEPEYLAIRKGEKSANELGEQIENFLRFEAGNIEMYAPASVSARDSFRTKDGRFRAMHRSSSSVEDGSRDLALDSDEIKKLGGPKKAAYSSVATYIGSNSKTVERLYKSSVERRARKERCFGTFLPSNKEFCDYLQSVVSQYETALKRRSSRPYTLPK